MKLRTYYFWTRPYICVLTLVGLLLDDCCSVLAEIRREIDEMNYVKTSLAYFWGI